jgi:hypothetical protein
MIGFQPVWPPPWEEIDAGIRPVIRAMVGAGFTTWACCEGHGDENPWVDVSPGDDHLSTCSQLLDWLRGSELHGATVSLYWYVNASHVGGPLIHVEWWSKTPILDWTNKVVP